MTSIEQIYEEICTILQNRRITFERLEPVAVYMTLPLRCVLKHTSVVIIIPSPDTYIIKGYYPLNVDATNLAPIAEYFCRINTNLPSGRFDLDFDDGELSFMINVDCSECDAISEEKLFTHMRIVLEELEAYAYNMLKVILGSMSPKKAVDDAESDLEYYTIEELAETLAEEDDDEDQEDDDDENDEDEDDEDSFSLDFLTAGIDSDYDFADDNIKEKFDEDGNPYYEFSFEINPTGSAAKKDDGDVSFFVTDVYGDEIIFEYGLNNDKNDADDGNNSDKDVFDEFFDS